MQGPLVIGGTGGSGTRVVARMVRSAGRYMGAQLNDTDDAGCFFRFDWRWGIPYLKSGASPAMEREFEETVEEHLASRPGGSSWGWKAPHSYLMLPFLRRRFPTMRYIHMVRDGRDMALSGNQVQSRRYGELLRRPDEPGPVRAAAWWAWANSRASQAGKELGADYLVVRLEDLCLEPTGSIRRIAEFSGTADTNFAARIKPPQSLGRWRECDKFLLGKIEEACGEALRRFGYQSS